MNEKLKFWPKLERWLTQQGMDPGDILRAIASLGSSNILKDPKLSFRELFGNWLKRPVPDHSYQLGFLGGIVFFLVVLQAVTGSLLAFYYRPAPSEAYASIQHIVTYVRLGWLARQLHSWGANLLILTAILHLFVVFLRKAYEGTRELQWSIGVLLLFLLLSFGFTGYLLPWDNAAYWSTAVGTGVVGGLPLLGRFLLLFLRGEIAVGGATLSRFYASHVILLPWGFFLGIAAHILILLRLGLAEPAWGNRTQKTHPFYPNQLFLAGIVLYLVFGLLLTLAILGPIPLGDRADFLSTPEGTKPPWYFLAAYQFIKYLPGSLGISLAFLGCLCLFLWPAIDRFLMRRYHHRKASTSIGIAVFVFLVLFTLLGSFAERTIRLGGTFYRFDTHAFPHRVK